MNPSTAFATVFTDELIRCGLREVVLAPGSRSAPLAMALHERCADGPLRLHVRIDERTAAFLALGLAKASGRPAAVLCTSGSAAANFHPAVIEADESGVPLLLLTADRPPELRGTGANQTIDQIKLYGGAVRWFSEAGVPEDRPAQAAYWRSLACRAWVMAAGDSGTFPGPVHLNLSFRDPLVPDRAGEPLPGAMAGRAGGQPWTRAVRPPDAREPALELDWAERGVVICGDATADPAAAVALAEQAGWPLLAEPSSGARRGPMALSAYQYLLDHAEFMAAHRPDVIVSTGRPGLSRGQVALLGSPAPGGRHVVLSQAPGRWSDTARSATHIAARLILRGGPAGEAPGWLRSWQAADGAARAAAGAMLDAGPGLSEPLLARAVAAALPDGALLWAAASLPARDLDRQMAPRPGLRVLASRGASGIDGTASAAIGAALAHQSAGGGPAAALIGDLALVHDAPGLMLGPAEPVPDLCMIVVNNDGGGIFSGLEQAAFPASFERVFGTPHGTDFAHLAAAAGLPYALLADTADLGLALAGSGLRLCEVRNDRAAGAVLRADIASACSAAIAAL